MNKKFIQIVEKVFVFLISDFGFKKIETNHTKFAIVLYYCGKVAIAISFETYEFYIDCSLYKIPEIKIKDCNLSGTYPDISLRLIAEELGYPPFQLDEIIKENWRKDTRLFFQGVEDELTYFANILKDKRHNLLNGNFDTPAKVKEAMEESEREVAYLQKYIGAWNRNNPN